MMFECVYSCTDDGAIRIHRDFLPNEEKEKKKEKKTLVTAFKGLSELVQSERGKETT